MTIFVNGRFSTQPLSGVQRYAGEIIRALDDLAGTASAREIVLLSPPGAPAAGLVHIEQRWVGRTQGISGSRERSRGRRGTAWRCRWR